MQRRPTTDYNPSGLNIPPPPRRNLLRGGRRTGRGTRGFTTGGLGGGAGDSPTGTDGAFTAVSVAFDGVVVGAGVASVDFKI